MKKLLLAIVLACLNQAIGFGFGRYSATHSEEMKNLRYSDCVAHRVWDYFAQGGEGDPVMDPEIFEFTSGVCAERVYGDR